MASHKFQVGQLVSLTSHQKFHKAPPGSYRIVQTLPPRDQDYQYRIKSDRENHERVADERHLAAAANS